MLSYTVSQIKLEHFCNFALELKTFLLPLVEFRNTIVKYCVELQHHK